MSRQHRPIPHHCEREGAAERQVHPLDVCLLCLRVPALGRQIVSAGTPPKYLLLATFRFELHQLPAVFEDLSDMAAAEGGVLVAQKALVF